jgi:hypothetical protein
MSISSSSSSIQQGAYNAPFENIESPPESPRTQTQVEQLERSLSPVEQIKIDYREVIMVQVKQGILHLQYLPDVIKKDKELVYEAVKASSTNFIHADESLKKDASFILKLIHICEPSILKEVPQRLFKDQLFVLALLRINEKVIDYLPNELFEDKEMLPKLVYIAPRSIEKAPKELITEEFFEALFIINAECLKYAPESIRKNQQLIKSLILKTHRNFAVQYAHEEVQNSGSFFTDFFAESDSQDTNIFNYLGSHLKSDLDFFKTLITRFRFPSLVTFASKELRENKEALLKLIALDHKVFKYIPYEISRNDSFVTKALEANNKVQTSKSDNQPKRSSEYLQKLVSSNPNEYRDLNNIEKKDRQVALILAEKIDEDPSLFPILVENFPDDKELAIIALKKEPALYKDLGPSLKTDIQMIHLALEFDPKLFLSIPEEIRLDKSKIIPLLSVQGLALEYYSEEDRQNPLLVLLAVQQNPKAFKFALGLSLENPHILNAALSSDGLQLQNANEKTRSDPKLVIKAIQNNWVALQFALNEAKLDREVVSHALFINPLALEHVHDDFKTNTLIKKLVARNGNALAFALPDQRDSWEIVSEAIDNCGIAFEFASENIRSKRYAARKAVLKNGLALQFASVDWRKDYRICSKAVLNDGLALQYCSDELRKDPIFVLQAISQNPRAILYSKCSYEELTNTISKIEIDSQVLTKDTLTAPFRFFYNTVVFIPKLAYRILSPKANKEKESKLEETPE